MVVDGLDVGDTDDEEPDEAVHGDVSVRVVLHTAASTHDNSAHSMTCEEQNEDSRQTCHSSLQCYLSSTHHWTEVPAASDLVDHPVIRRRRRSTVCIHLVCYRWCGHLSSIGAERRCRRGNASGRRSSKQADEGRSGGKNGE